MHFLCVLPSAPLVYGDPRNMGPGAGLSDTVPMLGSSALGPEEVGMKMLSPGPTDRIQVGSFQRTWDNSSGASSVRGPTVGVLAKTSDSGRT